MFRVHWTRNLLGSLHRRYCDCRKFCRDLYNRGVRQAANRSRVCAVRKALSALIPSKLDSTAELRIYSVQLGGQSFFVIQRAFQDYGSKPGYETARLRLIFAIGAMQQGRFRLLHWKETVDDENELVLGTIHLTNGRDFLITTVSDPESQSFRIYGIRNGRLTLVYSGGGASC